MLHMHHSVFTNQGFLKGGGECPPLRILCPPPRAFFVKANKVHLYSNTSRFSVKYQLHSLQCHVEVFQVFLTYTCTYTDTCMPRPPLQMTISISPLPSPLSNFSKKTTANNAIYSKINMFIGSHQLLLVLSGLVVCLTPRTAVL